MIYTIDEIRRYTHGAKNLRGTFAYVVLIQDMEDEFGCHADAVSIDIRDKNFLSEAK